jgi:fructose-bisphosphate aldolase class II
LNQYNLETIIGVVRAAEAKRSPVQILLFPWAITYANGLFVNMCADACRSATVPITLHLDHAQDPEIIKIAANMPNAFDSIMVDMSHHEKEENLALTKELVAYCHERGIATEAEPGRMEGGEDGVKDTGDLEGVLTTPEEALRFVDTGIDFLAPAFGNVHGNYGGVQNMKLDFDRYVQLVYL